MTLEPPPAGSSRLLFSAGFIDVYRADDGRIMLVDVRPSTRTVTVMERNEARFLGRALLRAAGRR